MNCQLKQVLEFDLHCLGPELLIPVTVQLSKNVLFAVRAPRGHGLAGHLMEARGRTFPRKSTRFTGRVAVESGLDLVHKLRQFPAHFCRPGIILLFDCGANPFSQLPEDGHSSKMQGCTPAVKGVERNAGGERIQASRLPHPQEGLHIVLRRLLADDTLRDTSATPLGLGDGLKQPGQVTLVIVGLSGGVLSAGRAAILSALSLAVFSAFPTVSGVGRLGRCSTVEWLAKVDSSRVRENEVEQEVVVEHGDLFRLVGAHLGWRVVAALRGLRWPLPNYAHSDWQGRNPSRRAHAATLAWDHRKAPPRLPL
ncbi:hypothetical protein [Bradyrhizobium sp. sBnM-33]|uniref:hypothetical protein n=1 Tax=Bradyrhizobium sp. sBnM-33 TaxID=2831780 RepID=UPI001BCD12AC|nr:hypothetical protein [Bradyrhizobium sp. sBnM-33]WOH48240.1 hypothetical protein RX328_29460 [Bradyrhizobium sp. sBnM-33]